MVLVEQACTDAIRPLAVCENHKDVTSPVLKMTTPAAIQRILLIVCCATFDVEDTVAWTNNEVGDFTNGELALARTDDARVAHARAAAELLAEPLGRDRAVRLALLNSPVIQTMLANSWAEGADAAQSGRIPNPVFSYESLSTDDNAEVEIEIERLFAFGLLDVLTLPFKQRIAKRRIERARLQLAADVIDQVTEVRQAWVEAVAAQQTLEYASQVRESAAAAAELARRMESVGNFSRLARVRQHMFYADATTDLAAARHHTRSTRERLVRLLGLDERQVEMLVLPDQLPGIPDRPIQPDEVPASLNERRLDVVMAKADLEAAGHAQGSDRITSFIDIEAGFRSATVFTRGEGDDGGSDSGSGHESADGYELELEIPLFDWGGMQRAGSNARVLAAANTYEATLRAAASLLRESYSAYRTSFDITTHYRDEILPLVETISEENVLQYNGMFIGVFELLADSRTAIDAVMAGIDAQRQFWSAEAALQASITGRPMMADVAAVGVGDGGDGEAH